jgi:hypothetical protein
MSLVSLLKRLPKYNSGARRQQPRCRPFLELLEDRLAPANLVVTNTNDSGVGSLRFAVDAANFTPAVSDIITFALPAGQKTIGLLANDTNNPFAFGPTALVITGQITIEGDPTQPGVTISGLNVHRVFAVASGATLTLDYVTVTGGVAQGGAGGDVLSNNGGGSGGGGAGLGGAIFVNGGTLIVQNSTLVGNAAIGGRGGDLLTGGPNPGAAGGGAAGGKGGDADGDGTVGAGGGGVGGPGSMNTGSTSGNGGANELGVQASAIASFGGGGSGTSPSGVAATIVGGFGGGGGGASSISGSNGGSGGFGGGGGGNIDSTTGGQGGFAGGGGGTTSTFTGLGGFGGGSGGTGSNGGGGGGAGLGGAIFNNAGTVFIINSTITGNLAQGGAVQSSLVGPGTPIAGTGAGAGVFSRNGDLTISNSTFYLNQADNIFVLGDASGGFSTAGVGMNNNIVSNDRSSGVADVVASTISGGSTVIAGGGNLIQITSVGNLGIVSTANPQLGPLANNGGPTQTFLPAATSPAIGAGIITAAVDAAGNPLSTDQRGPGFAIINANAVTIGAVSGLSLQARFVQTLYLDDLGRSGSLAELEGWVNVLNSPTGSQETVAAAISNSFEARVHVVDGWYLKYLGRPAAHGEEMGWANLLLTQTQEQVLSQILGGVEFFNRAQTLTSSGTPDERYVAALYMVVLNRQGGDLEVAGWLTQLPTIDLQQAALGFLQSFEYRFDTIMDDYTGLLHRPPATAEAEGWQATGEDIATLRIGFESSSEFFTKG